jgi:hypothetical protein
LNSIFLNLESSKNELKSLIQDRFKSDDVVKTLEQDRIRLQTELDLVKRDLEERNRELQKERTRIENMIRQDQVRNFCFFIFILLSFLELSIKTKSTYYII